MGFQMAPPLVHWQGPARDAQALPVTLALAAWQTLRASCQPQGLGHWTTFGFKFSHSSTSLSLRAAAAPVTVLSRASARFKLPPLDRRGPPAGPPRCLGWQGL